MHALVLRRSGLAAALSRPGLRFQSYDSSSSVAAKDEPNIRHSNLGKVTRLAVIGGGKMAEALVCGLISETGPARVDPANMMVSDPHPARRAMFTDGMGVPSTPSNAEAVDGAGLVLLCVKPQTLPKALAELKESLSDGALVVSIAAGEMLETLQGGLGTEMSVVRAMPNTPAMVGKGMTVWIASENVSEEQREFAQLVFQSCGKEVEVFDESYLDMATAISGTGPAYSFLVAEAMVDTGVHMGLPREIAQEMVNETLLGAAHYAVQSKQHPAILRNDITSPGGTTAAAMFEAEKNGLRSAMSNTIWAAYNRSVEIGQRAKGK